MDSEFLGIFELRRGAGFAAMDGEEVLFRTQLVAKFGNEEDNFTRRFEGLGGDVLVLFNAEQKRFLVFITKHIGLPALTVAKLYIKRWDINVFFKWIQGNLLIKDYYGTSLIALKTQIWIALTTYLLVVYHGQGTDTTRKHAQNSTDFDRSPVREDFFA